MGVKSEPPSRYPPAYASEPTPTHHRHNIPFDFSFTPTPQTPASAGYPIDPGLESLEYKRMSGEANARGSTSSLFDQHHSGPDPYLQPPVPRLPFSSFALSPHAHKDPGLNWLDSIFDPSGFNSGFDGMDPGASSGWGQGQGGGFASDQAQLLSLESPEHLLANLNSNGGAATGASPSLNLLLNPMKREPQLEDVTSWANISHFISLFLQYLYPLEPLVHRPTFAEHLATRRDRKDMDFRALLLSIGECQPILSANGQSPM
jgi:hypothetical protein